MITVAHLADLHIGYNHFPQLRTPEGQNQREADFEAAALAAADYLVDVRPDLVIIAGDLLHDTRITNRGLAGARRFCLRLTEAGLPVVVIGGNHDQAEGEASYPALELLRDTGIELYLEQATIERAGVRLHLLPFRALSKSQRGKAELEPFAFSEELPNVMVAHASCEGESELIDEEVMVRRLWLDDARFELICLGHIHQHRQLNERAFYAGSTERRNFGERDREPAFYLHRFSSAGQLVESETVRIADLDAPGIPRPMRQVDFDLRGLTVDALERDVDELIAGPGMAGALVKFELAYTTAAWDREQTRLRARWQEAFRNQGGLHLDISAYGEESSDVVDVDFKPQTVGRLDDLFASFVTEREQAKPASERAAMVALVGEIGAHARERLLSEEAD